MSPPVGLFGVLGGTRRLHDDLEHLGEPPGQLLGRVTRRLLSRQLHGGAQPAAHDVTGQLRERGQLQVAPGLALAGEPTLGIGVGAGRPGQDQVHVRPVAAQRAYHGAVQRVERHAPLDRRHRVRRRLLDQLAQLLEDRGGELQAAAGGIVEAGDQLARGQRQRRAAHHGRHGRHVLGGPASRRLAGDGEARILAAGIGGAGGQERDDRPLWRQHQGAGAGASCVGDQRLGREGGADDGAVGDAAAAAAESFSRNTTRSRRARAGSMRGVKSSSPQRWMPSPLSSARPPRFPSPLISMDHG